MSGCKEINFKMPEVPKATTSSMHKGTGMSWGDAQRECVYTEQRVSFHLASRYFTGWGGHLTFLSYSHQL